MCHCHFVTDRKVGPELGSWPAVSFELRRLHSRKSWDKRTWFGRVTLLWHRLSEFFFKFTDCQCIQHNSTTVLFKLAGALWLLVLAVHPHPFHHICTHITLKTSCRWDIQALQTTMMIIPHQEKGIHLACLACLACLTCYDFRRLRQSSTVIVSKVQNQMSLEECKS